MLRAISSYALITLVFVLPSCAQTSGRPTLKGLEGVQVRIEVWGEDGKKLIDADALGELLVKAQLQLRQDGIKVPDKIDAIPGGPLLTIAFAFYDISRDNTVQGYAFAVVCRLAHHGDGDTHK